MATRKRPSKSVKPKILETRRSLAKQFPLPTTAAKEPGSTEASRGRPSKQSLIIAMLRQPAGASIATIVAATGWQEHSVRGFFAAVVKKRFGLRLISEKGDSERVYRIVNADPAP